MNQVVTDIWPYLVVPIAGIIGWLFREVFVMKTKMAVVEKSIDSFQKRLDSHSKKQDEILERLSSMDKEMTKQIGNINVSMTSLASDYKSLTHLFSISDAGIKIHKTEEL